MRKKLPLEKDVQRDVRGAYMQFGCIVYSFSQPRASMQTPGIPDLLVFHEPSRTQWWHEVKVKGRAYTQTRPQLDFDCTVSMCQGHYILGGVPEALNALRDIAGIKIQKENDGQNRRESNNPEDA